MKTFIGLLVRLFLAFFILLTGGIFLLNSNILSPSASYNEEFGFLMNGKGYFPVTDEAHIYGIKHLTDAERKMLLDKIRIKTPERDAALALSKGDYRLIAAVTYSSGVEIGLACHYMKHPGLKYSLIVGDKQNLPYEKEIKWAWSEYGKRYNYKIFHGSPSGTMENCTLI